MFCIKLLYIYMDLNGKKKLAFVTHEFGLFKGHGGVASYLYLLVSDILKYNKNYEITVISILSDKNCELLTNPRLHLYDLFGDNLHKQGENALNILKEVKPDYVEFTDYLGLAVESLTYRISSGMNELSNTVFITLHHTASRECYEWNDKVSIKFAPYFIRESFRRESTQMRLCDINVAPSKFMVKYVKKNYYLNQVDLVPHPLMLKITDKSSLREQLYSEYNTDEFKNKFIINCISRIEGRKNQLFLIEQFIKFVEKSQADALLILVGNSSVNSVTQTDFTIEFYNKIPRQYRKRIKFFNFMGPQEKANILALSHVSVLGSTFECLSLAMTESVCAGTPAIVSKYCGFADYLDGCEQYCLFDPFKEGDLAYKLEVYYSLNDDSKKRIEEIQLKNLVEKASYKNAVSNRLKLYESFQQPSAKVLENSFVLSPLNFQDIITSDFINKKFTNIIINWDMSKKTSLLGNLILKQTASKFMPGEVIYYGTSIIQLSFVDLIINYIPFCIIQLNFDDSMIGLPLWQAVIMQCDYNQRIYGLLDDSYRININNYLCGEKKCNDDNTSKIDYFKKYMLDFLFIRKNQLQLEELYAE